MVGHCGRGLWRKSPELELAGWQLLLNWDEHFCKHTSRVVRRVVYLMGEGLGGAG